MALYQVTGPDGNLYQIEGPEGATRDQVISQIQTQLKPNYFADVPRGEATPETTIGGHAKEFVKGLGAGAVGLAETAGTGISALFTDKVEKQARQAMKEGLAGAKEYLAPEKGYEDSMSRKLGEGLGSTLPFFALGPAGAVGRVAGMGLGVSAGAGEARQRAEAEGVTGGDRGLATFLGIGPGMLDVVAPEFRIGKSMITRALTSGGLEGATEAAQQVAQNLISKGIYNPEQGAFADVVESGGYGAGTGALASMLLDVALKGHAKHISTKERKAAEQKAAEDLRVAQERYTPGETPAGPMAQGELFTPEAAPAPEAPVAAAQAAAAPTPTPEAPPQPVAAPEAQGQLDLSTGQTLEQQVAELDRQDAEAKGRQEMAAAEKDLETLKLQLESDVAETDARVARGEEQKAVAQRKEALLSVIEDPNVTNIPRAFNDALVRLGYSANTRFTPEERETINRAIDIKEAKPEVPEPVQPGVDRGADTAAMEALVPEKQPKPVAAPTPTEAAAPEPAPAVAPAPAPVPTGPSKADQEIAALQAAGIETPGVAPIEAAPAPVEAVAPAQITKPKLRVIKKADLQRIEPMDVQQYVPGVGMIAQAKPQPVAESKEMPSADTGVEPAAVGISPEGVVGERGERGTPAVRAAGTKAPEAAGLGAAKRLPNVARAREGKPPVAVKETREEREAKEQKIALNEFESFIETEIRKKLEEPSGPTLAELIAAKKSKKLEGPVALVPDVSKSVQEQLKAGDLKGALSTLAGTLDGVAGRITRQLSTAIGDTKVEVVTNLKDEDGNPVAGLFDPTTNTIKLDSKTGVSSHTVIHEAVHAATSHVLENKSHPVTRQLQQLFDDVKGSLDTMYGAQSLDEFVAEAFSNPEFQAKLAAISPKGAPVSAWQRFTNVVGNFLRRMVGMEPTSGTAMSEADKLISAIMSPSPATRDAGSLYMLSALGKGGEWIDNIVKNRSFLPDGPNVDAFHEFFTGTVPKAAKKALSGALPLHAFVDVAQSRIPTAETLKRTIEKQSSEDHKAIESLNESVKDVNRWYRKQSRDVRETFDRIGPDSSRLQVDPSKPRSEYANKKDADGNDLGKAWDSLQDDWKKIGPEGQKQYKMMRDTYAKQRDKIQELLGARIDETVDNAETATALKNEIYKRLAERGGIDPYFPLHREGDYWLMFTGKDPRFGNVEPVVRAFTSKRARDRFIAELKAEGVTDIKEYGNFRASNFKGLPPTSFASSVVKTLEANKVDTETIDQVMRLYIDLLPESSFAQSFRTRKGTLGYEGSAVDTFRKKTFSTERQMSSMKFGAQYAKIIADTEEHVKSTGSDPASVLMADELIARAKLAASPQTPKWAKVATALNFNMFMGLNLSSALVNMTQIPLVVAPYLGGKYGMKETTQAIGRATKIVMNSGKDRQIDDYLTSPDKPIKRTVKSYLSIDNYDYSKHKELKHLETLARIADERGQLNHSQMQDALDMDSTDTILGRANAVTGFVFHHGERVNRQVSMVAAYELELQKLVGKGKPLSDATQEQMEAAAHEAIFNTEITNGDTSAAAAPRLAQGPSGIGKVMFLFKRYGASMYYMLFKTAKQALSMKKPEGMSAEEWNLTRKAAMKQLAGIYGSSALLAGVRGVPLFGLMAWMFDLFRDDDEDNAATLAQKWMGETAYKGALNALTGFEISGRVGLSDLIFRDNIYNKDLTPTQALFQTLGGPLLSVADKAYRGYQQINDGNVERGIEQIAPTAVGNMMKSMRYATEGATTLRGDPITGEIGAWNVAGQFFGFAPAEYIQQQEINANIKRIDKSTNQKRTKLLKQYYVALREGDADGMREILTDMNEFSQKHPGARITGETIKNSMAQHQKTTGTMYHGIQLSKNMRGELMGNVSEYDNGIDLFD